MSTAVDRVRATAKVLGFELEVREFAQGTRTADEAARAIGCEPAQIVKSLVWWVGGRPVLVLVSGLHRLDPERLAVTAGVGPVRAASPAEVLDLTGYAVGATPPFGHRRALPAFCDRTLLDHDVVWCAAGTPTTVFPIAPDALVVATGATVADLAGSS